jgi:hypothetical protein
MPSVDDYFNPETHWYKCVWCQGIFLRRNTHRAPCPFGRYLQFPWAMYHIPDFQYGEIELVHDYRLPGQHGWKWCGKCQGLWYSPKNWPGGVCPAGGRHGTGGSWNYSLIANTSDWGGDDGWRWCSRCQGLWYSGAGGNGFCPAGGAHSLAGSWDYWIQFAPSASFNGDMAWNPVSN